MSESADRQFRDEIARIHDQLADEIQTLEYVVKSPKSMAVFIEASDRCAALVKVKRQLLTALSSGSEPWESDGSSKNTTTTKI